MLEIEYKQKIRDFCEAKMAISRREAKVYRFAPAIVVRENEMEKFIDDLWLELNKKTNG